MREQFWLENPKGRNHVEDLGGDGTKIKKWIFGKRVCSVWIGIIWLGIGTGGGLL
jgi:hypothetical protein